MFEGALAGGLDVRLGRCGGTFGQVGQRVLNNLKRRLDSLDLSQTLVDGLLDGRRSVFFDESILYEVTHRDAESVGQLAHVSDSGGCIHVLITRDVHPADSAGVGQPVLGQPEALSVALNVERENAARFHVLITLVQDKAGGFGLNTIVAHVFLVSCWPPMAVKVYARLSPNRPADAKMRLTFGNCSGG